MIFDILFLVFLFAFIFAGYRKGIVSIALSLGLVAISFVIAMYVSMRWNFIDVPVFGTWIQTFIIFAILSGISRWIVSLIDFEELAVVGFFSRLLGSILYGTIFTVVVLGIVAIVLYVTPTLEFQYFEGSIIIEWLRELLQKIELNQLELMRYLIIK